MLGVPRMPVRMISVPGMPVRILGLPGMPVRMLGVPGMPVRMLGALIVLGILGGEGGRICLAPLYVTVYSRFVACTVCSTILIGIGYVIGLC